MKHLLVIAGLLASTAAYARPYTPSMSCADARALVRSSGAVVLSTGDGLFDRYVAHRGYCQRDEVTRPAWVPTRDSNACKVGYTCEQRR